MYSKEKQAGFTLIELIMVTVILGILSVVLGKILLQSYHGFTTENNIAENNWKGFYVWERFINDVHNMRSYSDVSSMTPSQFSFVDKSGNDIVYLASGTNLLRNGQVLADNVYFCTFYYFNIGAAITATASTLSFIYLTFYILQGDTFVQYAFVFGPRYPV